MHHSLGKEDMQDIKHALLDSYTGRPPDYQNAPEF
jgi:hypothetical protein